MNYLSIVVESTGVGSFSTLHGDPVYQLPVTLKREVSSLLKQEGEKIGEYADVQARLNWEEEAAQMQADQERDLASPELAWWDPRPITEAEYFNQLSEIYGKTEAVA